MKQAPPRPTQDIARLEAENAERYKLGIHKPYMRQLP